MATELTTLKPSGPLHVLILHSTDDNLGVDTANEIITGIQSVSDVKLTACREFEGYSGLIELLEEHAPDEYNIILLLMHGDCMGRIYVKGEAEPVYPELVMQAFPQPDDKLFIFGICRSGTPATADTVCGITNLALALIAPQSEENISGGELVKFVPAFLRECACLSHKRPTLNTIIDAFELTKHKANYRLCLYPFGQAKHKVC